MPNVFAGSDQGAPRGHTSPDAQPIQFAAERYNLLQLLSHIEYEVERRECHEGDFGGAASSVWRGGDAACRRTSTVRRGGVDFFNKVRMLAAAQKAFDYLRLVLV